MSLNIREWLNVATEEHNDAGPVIIQDGDTPKEDFSEAINEDTTGVDIAAPAVAEIPAASDDAPKQTVKDQGHQEVRISAEDGEEDLFDEVPLVEAGEPVDVASDIGGSDVTKATLQPAEAGDEQETPEADDQVKPQVSNEEVDTVSIEDFVDPLLETEVAEVREQVDAVEDDIAHFEKVSAAVEAYQSLLADALDGGEGISAQTAQAMRVGLEGIDSYFCDTQPIASLEAFEIDAVSATEVSLEDIKGTMKSVADAAKRAIQKLFDMLYELWTAITGGAARAAKRLDAIKERLKALKGTSVNKTLSVKGSARLSVDGIFAGNDPKAVDSIGKVADYIYNDYPKQMEGFVKEAIELYRGLTPAIINFDKSAKAKVLEALVSFNQLPRKHLKPPTSKETVTDAELPPSLDKYPTLVRSNLLVGNYAVVSYIKEINTHGDKEPATRTMATIATMFHRIYNVSFVALNRRERSFGAENESYQVPTKSDMESMAAKLSVLLDQVVKSSGTKVKYNAIKKDIDRAVKDIAEKSGMNIQSIATEGARYAPHLVRSLQSLARLLVQPSGQFNGYVVSTVNAFMGLLNHNLNQFEAEIAPK